MNLRLKGRGLQVSAITGVNRLVVVMVLALLLGLIAVACSQGSYPVDIFQEMHYNQSQKAQEPDRLDVPAEAVPRPLPESRAKWARERATGEHLFIVNCSMCHGLAGRGDGSVLMTMIDKYGYQTVVTPNLASDEVQSLSDEALLAIISNGIQVMPAFRKLLTEEERLLIVDYIRQLQSR